MKNPKAFSFDKWKLTAKLLFSSFGDEDSRENFHFYNIYLKRGKFYRMDFRAGYDEYEKPKEISFGPSMFHA